MRRVLCARLLAASATVVIVAVATIASTVPASAKGAPTGNKPVKCATLSGTVGGNWSLMGCSPVGITGPANPAEQGAQGTVRVETLREGPQPLGSRRRPERVAKPLHRAEALPERGELGRSEAPAGKAARDPGQIGDRA